MNCYKHNSSDEKSIFLTCGISLKKRKYHEYNYCDLEINDEERQ